MTKHQIQRRCTLVAAVLAVGILAVHSPTTLLEAQQQPTDVAVVITVILERHRDMRSLTSLR
jgi:hypothetical protein